jgi:transcriptional regulator GlxA family with amidase domain
MRIGIPAYEGADLLDMTGPFEMFHWAGFEIDVLAESPGPKSTGSGFSFLVHTGFAAARNYDAIWVPGGEPAALARIIDDPARTYLDFLTDQASRARIMCSVCNGAMLLAAAGLLDGYQATTHWAFASCFPQRFPKMQAAPGHPRFIHDRNRLTAGGVASGLDAALKLIELFGGTSLAQRVQQDTQYYPDPPVSSEIPPSPTECSIPLNVGVSSMSSA